MNPIIRQRLLEFELLRFGILAGIPMEQLVADIEASQQLVPPIVPPDIDAEHFGFLVMNSYTNGFIN